MVKKKRIGKQQSCFWQVAYKTKLHESNVMLGKIKKMYNFLQNALNHGHWSINDGEWA